LYNIFSFFILKRPTRVSLRRVGLAFAKALNYREKGSKKALICIDDNSSCGDRLATPQQKVVYHNFFEKQEFSASKYEINI